MKVRKDEDWDRGEELTVVASEPTEVGGDREMRMRASCCRSCQAACGGHVTWPRGRTPRGLFRRFRGPGGRKV